MKQGSSKDKELQRLMRRSRHSRSKLPPSPVIEAESTTAVEVVFGGASELVLTRWYGGCDLLRHQKVH
jgi:hypothetical protein